MVKASLTGKKQTTTQALGAGVARWIMQAGCGVMVLIGGELISAEIVPPTSFQPPAVHLDNGVMVPLASCRIYRETIRQIKSLIGLA